MSKIMPIAYIDLKRYFGEIGGGYFLRVTLLRNDSFIEPRRKFFSHIAEKRNELGKT